MYLKTKIGKRLGRVCLVSLLISLSCPLFAQENTYPTAERLFHIERSKNRNLVCYDVNLVDGKLNTKKPLVIYWIDREEEPGLRKELNALQRQMAYGYKLFSEGDDSAELTLTAYSERVLTVRKMGEKYVCLITIDGRQCVLHHLYVKAKSGNSLSVEYVELFGISVDTRREVTERIQK